LPLVLSFQWAHGDSVWADFLRAPWLVLSMTAITSVMMVSRLPTPSIKYMRLSREHRLMAGFLGGILAMLLIEWPWATLTGVLLIYMVTIPVAVYVHHPRTVAMRAAKSASQS
jgi:phosphatidylserine synthase